MKKVVMLIVLSMMILLVLSCNNDLTSSYDGQTKKSTVDRSQRTVIDPQEYIDFTIHKYNAQTHKREDILYTLGDSKTFKNGNSTIKINMSEGTIEIVSDNGFQKGQGACQVYGKFGIDVVAASTDCLYIRRNPKKTGMLIIDKTTYKNDQIPDLSVCLPLYGYSKNRIEVSSIMNGYIAMPSGTYWRQ